MENFILSALLLIVVAFAVFEMRRANQEFNKIIDNMNKIYKELEDFDDGEKK